MSGTKKELTDQQQTFLNALYASKGNIRAAMDEAGYAKSTGVHYIINALKDEILEVAKRVVAAHAVEAAFGAVDVMNNSAQLGAANKLKAAEALMTRAGVQKNEDTITSDVKHIVILPAKRYKIVEEE